MQEIAESNDMTEFLKQCFENYDKKEFDYESAYFSKMDIKDKLKNAQERQAGMREQRDRLNKAIADNRRYIAALEEDMNKRKLCEVTDKIDFSKAIGIDMNEIVEAGNNITDYMGNNDKVLAEAKAKLEASPNLTDKEYKKKMADLHNDYKPPLNKILEKIKTIEASQKIIIKMADRTNQLLSEIKSELEE